MKKPAVKKKTDKQLLDYVQSNLLRVEWSTFDGTGKWPCQWRVVNTYRNAYDFYERHVFGSGETIREAITNAIDAKSL